MACGFDRADVVLYVGYDMVYSPPPHLWHPDRDKRIVHVDMCGAHKMWLARMYEPV